MNYSFLFFRCRQIGRFAKQTGLLYILLPLFLLSGGILRGMENILLLSNTSLVAMYLIVLIGLLYSRTDFDFLTHTEQSLYSIYLIDTGLFTIPYCIPFLIMGKWQAVLGFLIVGIFMALVWPFLASILNSKQIKSTALKIDVPVVDLELKYMVRQYGIIISVMYILCLVFSGYPAAIFIFTFMFLVFFQSTLEFYEPKEMIFYHESARQFLHSKIFRLWLYIQVFLLPLYVIGLCISFSSWYLFLLVFVASTVMIIFSVCNKYVFYRPSVLKRKTNMLAAIMQLFMLLPGFQLVVLLMSIIQYSKAKKNLNYYWEL